MGRRAGRALVVAVVLTAVAAAAALVWGRAQLRGSLPMLDGRHRLPGLGAPVRITRDALGVPTVHAATRADAARATGFLHGQDRFFQMDLSRRRAAGELAALVGARALPADRNIRVHRFRAEAERALALLAPDDRAILEAYSAGVNAGLAALRSPPFEYLVLRQDPAPWAPEDSLLVVLAMFVTLQDDDGTYEATLATMEDVLPPAMVQFLAPPGSEWDAPIVGPAYEMPPVPGPEVYDLRSRRTGRPAVPARPRAPDPDEARVDPAGWVPWTDDRLRDAAAIGSNSFVVAGRLTTDGRPLVANDMHLTIRVPNIWYRAVLRWGDPDDPAGGHMLGGVTLPGVPTVVVGSNAHVAWGFTNSYADWADIVLLEVDPARPGHYLTPDGWRPFDRFTERLDVAGGSPERLEVTWTIWGPLMPPDRQGRPRAYRWVAHSAERLAATVRPIETARTIEEAFDSANGVGAPGQNMVAADRAGRIGWTIYGSIPRRAGFSGRTPVSWADGRRSWDGWLSDAEFPRLMDPESGRIWTANARVVDGAMLEALGDGNYEIGSRARLIRERLFARERLDARALLDIQLDTRASFLERWRALLLRTLEQDRSGGAERAAVREVVADGWSGQAAPESAAYRLVRAFRDAASTRIITSVLVECYEADPAFNYTSVRRRDAPVWQMAADQPPHLLDPQYATWNDLLLASIDEVIEESMRGRPEGVRAPWSSYNVVAYQHPLSSALPFAHRWLDMPHTPLPGDLYTPRVHWGAIGASERMIVSPGNEEAGILHMPTGQSGHPLSPFYANSHGAWVRGEPSPFLPGAPAHTLQLEP